MIVNYGDYWETEDGQYRFTVVDFDYLYNTNRLVLEPGSSISGTIFDIHHVTVLCTKKPFGPEATDPTNEIATKGYAYCGWRVSQNGSRVAVRNALKSIFDNVFLYNDYLANGISSEGIVTRSWYQCDVELPTEGMLGFLAYDNAEDTAQSTRPFTFLNMDQYKFLSPIPLYTHIWLKDIVSKPHNFEKVMVNNYIGLIYPNNTSVYTTPFAHVR